MKIKVLIMVLFCLPCRLHAVAQNAFFEHGHSGNDLVAGCRGSDLEVISCMGYITGISEGWEAAHFFEKTRQTICIPKEVQTGQLVKVALKYADNHPEDLHDPARYLVILAFEEAFPCRGK